MSQASEAIETIPNPERGCGFLKEGKAYLRADISPDGILPTFVEFDEPIPWLEGHLRGYSYFPGVQFELAHTPAPDDYHGKRDEPVGSLDPAVLRDLPEVLDRVRSQEPDGEWTTRVDPPLEVHRHIRRLERGTGSDGEHVGEMRVARAHDLLMWVGETYYEEPDAFISECKSLGLSKAIPTGTNQEPPVINPGRTRVFLIHPNAVHAGTDDDGEPKFVPGIIGYSYVTRVIYTGIDTGDGIDFPEWAQEYAESDHFDLVRVGERVPEEVRENGSTLGEWTGEGSTPGDGENATAATSAPSEDTLRERLRHDVGYHELRSLLSEHGIATDANPNMGELIDAAISADVSIVPPKPASGGDDA